MRDNVVTASQLLQQIVEGGAILRIGSFAIEIKIQDISVAQEFLSLYKNYPFETTRPLPNFRIEIKSSVQLTSGLRRRLQAYVDHQPVFRSAPPNQGIPLLESVMNWLLGNRVVRYLLIHSAVVERHGSAVVLPGASGAGKSTLTAALIADGWRLLSDEATIINPGDGRVKPHPRPISLKNETIDLIARKYPQLTADKRYTETIKGTVAYVKAPSDAIRDADQTATPKVVIAPAYRPGSKLTLNPIQRTAAFMFLAKQSPNYKIMLDLGFHTMANLVESCRHYTLEYSDLDEAVTTINELSKWSYKETQAA